MLTPFAVAATAALLVLAAAAGAAAAPRKPDTGRLSARLHELAGPSVRDASPRRQDAAVSLPSSGPGSLVRVGDRVVVEVRMASVAAGRVDALRSAGAQVEHVSLPYDTVTAAVDPAQLESLAKAPRVLAVTEVLAPIFRATAGDPGARTALNTCHGSVTSEGDSQLNAADARGAMDVDGAGVKVGVLSDSYDRDATASTHASNDVASGDLPGSGNPCGHGAPVQVLDDSVADGEDEGRAMLQDVHDIAPGASLAFAQATGSQTSAADNIRALRSAGARVIVDDFAYLDEPFFQDGPIAQAVNDVTAGGVPYFSAAGNENIIDGGRSIASWESPAFRPSGSCPAAVGKPGTQCEDFDPTATDDNTFRMTVAPGGTVMVDLQWAQPWNGVTTDLDAYLLTAAGTVLDVGGDGNKATQKPFELASWTNSSGVPVDVFLAINRDSRAGVGDSGTPRLKFVLFGDVSSTEYETSSGGDVVGPTVFGHSGAANTQSIAAAPFTSNTTPEPYSSRGPMTQYFGPVAGSSPAPPLASPRVLSKPDVTATDCNRTTFFFGPSHRFCGTSSAAPHAAGVAALELQANPGLSAAQVKAVQHDTARPMGSFGPTDVGGGLLNAVPAVESLALPPQLSVSSAPAPLSANRTPLIAFSANRPAEFTCTVDGAAQSCGSPFTPAPLPDGRHTIVVAARDAASHTSTATLSFAVDGTAPSVRIRKHPSRRTRSRRATFTFSSSEPGSAFQCQVDRGRFRTCRSPKRLKARRGRHRFRVRAIDRAGNTGAAKSFSWRVTR
jgi:hypothetical protein